MAKRLYRSNKHKVIGGVCGGLGEYFNIDPVLVRIIAVILALGPGVGVLAYIVAWIIIPARPESMEVHQPQEEQPASWHKYLPGLILVAIGFLLLVRDHWFWFDWDQVWPLALIAVGVALIVRRTRNGEDTSEDTQTSHNAGYYTDNNGRGQ